jgi:hypothetical protein
MMRNDEKTMKNNEKQLKKMKNDAKRCKTMKSDEN